MFLVSESHESIKAKILIREYPLPTPIWLHYIMYSAKHNESPMPAVE